MTKAIWNNQVIAESNQTTNVEGNQYFPPEAIKKEFFKMSDNPKRRMISISVLNFFHFII